MIKHKLTFGASEIGSESITGFTLTESVNDGQDLTVGSTCSSMMECSVRLREQLNAPTPGDEISLYEKCGNEEFELHGKFFVESVEKQTKHTAKIVAYDAASKLGKDVSEVIKNTQFPVTLYSLAKSVIESCGLTLATDNITNGSYLISKFEAYGVTARDVCRFVGQASATFCRADVNGNIVFDWYSPASVDISYRKAGSDYDLNYVNGSVILNSDLINALFAGGQLDITSDIMSGSYDPESKSLVASITGSAEAAAYYLDSFEKKSFLTDRIGCVQIKFSDSDVGITWPSDGGENPYEITGNYLLASDDTESVSRVAENIYDVLSGVEYTPATVVIPTDFRIKVGNTVNVITENGKTYKLYVMRKRQSGSRDTIYCNGNKNRDNAVVQNSQSFKNLYGKYLNIEKSVDGIKIRNESADGRYAELEERVDGIKSEVGENKAGIEGNEKRISLIEQDSEKVSIAIKDIQENGVDKVTTETGYTFNKDGLRISKSESEMENLLDNTGMHVSRSGTPILTANNKGVNSIDITVRNYLIIGKHARFEDYKDGCGCFYI